MLTSKADSEISTLIRARYPIIYVVSWEERRVEDAVREIAPARQECAHVERYKRTASGAERGGSGEHTPRGSRICGEVH